MSVVDKLYELAGFKRSKPSCAECFLDRHSCCRSYDECPELYPPFTAEKQLELIKWLGKYDYFEVYYRPVQKDWIFGNKTTDSSHYDFTLGLASWVSYLWKDLTETEQEEIRKILKG